MADSIKTNPPGPLGFTRYKELASDDFHAQSIAYDHLDNYFEAFKGRAVKIMDGSTFKLTEWFDNRRNLPPGRTKQDYEAIATTLKNHLAERNKIRETYNPTIVKTGGKEIPPYSMPDVYIVRFPSPSQPYVNGTRGMFGNTPRESTEHFIELMAEQVQKLDKIDTSKPDYYLDKLIPEHVKKTFESNPKGLIKHKNMLRDRLKEVYFNIADELVSHVTTGIYHPPGYAHAYGAEDKAATTISQSLFRSLSPKAVGWAIAHEGIGHHNYDISAEENARRARNANPNMTLTEELLKSVHSLTSECRADLGSPSAFNAGKKEFFENNVYETLPPAMKTAFETIRDSVTLKITHPASATRIEADKTPENTAAFVSREEALRYPVPILPTRTDCKISRKTFNAIEKKLGTLPSPPATPNARTTNEKETPATPPHAR